MAEEVLAVHKFSLSIDKNHWGFFTQCTGLACSVVLDEFSDGGVNDSLRYLPKHLTYPPLTLTRPLTADAMRTCEWVQETARKAQRITMGIACLDSSGKTVLQWDLLNAMPVAWRGPILDAGGGGKPMEEVEIIHEGFISGLPGTAKS
ncbi:phage tail protein [Streptomyces sp. NPDC002537]